MKITQWRNKTKRNVLLLAPFVILLVCLLVIWVKNEFIFAAFTDFKRSLADTSIIDGAQLKKQRLEISIDPYEIVEMQLPKGQGKKLLSKNILKSCADKSQECTEPIWQCASDYNTLGGDSQNAIATKTDTCSVFCTATWWKVRDGNRNYIDEVCVDVQSDYLTYQYIET